MATEHETFGDVVRLVVGEKTLRKVAGVADVSHTYLSDWQGDKRPTLRTLLKAADAWEAKGWLRADLRARLFQAAGYVDPRGSDPGNEKRTTLEPVLDRINIKAFKQAQNLPDTDAEEMNENIEAMVQARLRRLGLD
jgi:transcriptional regulator with XRE-family HTH domain